MLDAILVAALMILQPTHHEAGRLSVYHPNDGMNSGQLACGGRFTSNQKHIAYRRWHRAGCGRMVVVRVRSTGRWTIAPIMDAGPFGIYTGKLQRAKQEGRWKVHTDCAPPNGWQWRAVADLSYALWIDLGRPKSLEMIDMWFLPFKARLDKEPNC